MCAWMAETFVEKLLLAALFLILRTLPSMFDLLSLTTTRCTPFYLPKYVTSQLQLPIHQLLIKIKYVLDIHVWLRLWTAAIGFFYTVPMQSIFLIISSCNLIFCLLGMQMPIINSMKFCIGTSLGSAMKVLWVLCSDLSTRDLSRHALVWYCTWLSLNIFYPKTTKILLFVQLIYCDILSIFIEWRVCLFGLKLCHP